MWCWMLGWRAWEPVVHVQGEWAGLCVSHVQEEADRWSVFMVHVGQFSERAGWLKIAWTEWSRWVRWAWESILEKYQLSLHLGNATRYRWGSGNYTLDRGWHQSHWFPSWMECVGVGREEDKSLVRGRGFQKASLTEPFPCCRQQQI